MTEQTFSADRRREPERVPLEGEVVVQIEPGQVIGSGQNLSEDGVFFVADGKLRVRVRIEGREGEFFGELVRVESLAAGQTGIAVRFDPGAGLKID